VLKSEELACQSQSGGRVRRWGSEKVKKVKKWNGKLKI